MNIIFVGPQGSGKGTQAKIIVKELGYVHLSTGVLFREEIEKGTELGKLADSLIQDGNIVPAKITNQIVLEKVTKLNAEAKKIILDGYPREIEQAEFAKQNLEIEKVVLIDISKQETIKRLSSRYHCPKCKKEYNTLYESLKPKNNLTCDVCGTKLEQREDDSSIDAIERRLQIYHDQTIPVLELFKDKIIKINGEQPIEKVTQDIIEKFNN